MGRTSIFDTVSFSKISARNMGHGPPVTADAQVDLRLTEIDRLKLGEDVCDVDQRDVAKGFEVQPLILSEPLLRSQLPPFAKTRGAVDGGCCHTGLQKIAA